MPTYDYKCNSCQSVFELFLNLSERSGPSEKKVCPACASKELSQSITRGMSVLKQGISKSPADGRPCNAGHQSAACGSCPNLK